MTDIYRILGLNKNATQQEIKSAYRKLAKENHPDKGGDMKKFADISEAYAIISNPESKEYYDTHGRAKDNTKNLFNDILIGLFYQTIDALRKDDQYLYANIFKVMAETIQRQERNFKKEIDGLKSKQRMLKIVKKRISSKKDFNIFHQTLDAQIDSLNKNIDKKNDQIDIGKKIIKFLKDFKYKTDEKKMINAEQEFFNILSEANSGTSTTR